MWSLRVTIFVQQARRRSVCRVAGDVDKKCQKTCPTACSYQKLDFERVLLEKGNRGKRRELS